MYPIAPAGQCWRIGTWLVHSMVLLVAGSLHARAQELDVPYVPTPKWVVERMLDMAEVGDGDYVIDLGSGDGRIVIAAAGLGAEGHGVDLNVIRVREARENAVEQGVADRVMFMRENIFDTDFSAASVITLYLLPSVNEKLRPRLFETLEPGTRVVSHSFDMGDWEPDAEYDDNDSLAGYHNIYMWVIPADAAGTWRWESADRAFHLKIGQLYQEVDLRLRSAGDDLEVREPLLRGRRLRFATTTGGQEYLFNGRIEDERITGYVQIRGDEEHLLKWSARRLYRPPGNAGQRRD